jgi:predicted nucleotidyltransferase
VNRKEEIKSMIRQVTDIYLVTNYSVFLFGSQAGSAELKRADIDVGIEAEQPLSLLEESLIWNALEDLPTLYNFDLIDFKKADEKFREIALQNIEML